MENILIFPDISKIQKDNERLKAEITMAVLERDDLKFNQCRNIETAYMLKLGNLEYKAYKAECDMLREKRKMELVQARINRQEQIDLKSIGHVLDEEFLEYQSRLDERLDRMNEALKRSKGEYLSDAESKELKQLYRKIIKALHPDLHPELSQSELNLFYQAVDSYESGDLQGLRLIETMVAEDGKQVTEDALSMEKKNERLKGILASLQDEIEKIKSSFPYNKLDLLEDDAAVEKEKEKLEALIAQYEEQAEIYRVRTAELMEAGNGRHH